MKTFDEIRDALTLVLSEANKSGFAISAVVTSGPVDETTSIFSCGKDLICLAQIELLKNAVLERIIKNN